MQYFHAGPGHYLVVKRPSSPTFEAITSDGCFVPVRNRRPKDLEVTLEQIFDNPQWFSVSYLGSEYYLVLIQLLV